jgi:hypothetical protein
VTARPRVLLRLVDDGHPVDELLAALEAWRNATGSGTGEPFARLEVGDSEITGDGWLTAAQVRRLARLIVSDAGAVTAARGAAR